MSGIFPPAGQGGRPPGGNICNGFSPTHRVIGEGPLFVAADCTTTLTDCQLNSIVSEILAAVDIVNGGVPYNANRVDNLGLAIQEAFATVYRAVALRVLRAGDTMEGPLELSRDPQEPMETATRRFVLQQDNELDVALRAVITAAAATVDAAWRLGVAQVDERKINRAGDSMTGTLVLAHDPVNLLDAVTKQYSDAQFHMQEAPMTGEQFVRQNGQWVTLTGISTDDGAY